MQDSVLYIYEFFACVCVCITYMPGIPMGPRALGPLELNDEQLWAAWWVLGTESAFSAKKKKKQVLTSCALSLSPWKVCFVFKCSDSLKYFDRKCRDHFSLFSVEKHTWAQHEGDGPTSSSVPFLPSPVTFPHWQLSWLSTRSTGAARGAPHTSVPFPSLRGSPGACSS